MRRSHQVTPWTVMLTKISYRPSVFVCCGSNCVSAQTQVNSSSLTDVVQGTVSGHQRWSTVNKTCPLYKRLCLCRCTCENVFIKLSRPRVFKFCRMDFFVFRLQTTWNMAPPADSHDRKLSQHQSIFSWKSINSLRPSWWKQNLFSFHLNFFFLKFFSDSFPSGTDKLLLCETSALQLINIYGRVSDAAFKVPSTQHLTAASLYSRRPSPRSPVLKQSIMKEQLSAITLSDPNGISSGMLKARHFSSPADMLGHVPASSGVWRGYFPPPPAPIVHLGFLLLWTRQKNKVFIMLSAALTAIWWNEVAHQTG